MPEPELTPEELKRRQHAQEQAEREALEATPSDEEALVHQRRADKARYLREKLESQSRADRDDD